MPNRTAFAVVGTIGFCMSSTFAGQHEDQELFASNPTARDYFGNSVASDGDWILGGAYFKDTDGRAFLYRRDSSTGQFGLYQELAPSDDTSAFGMSVAISGDVAVVGSPIWTGGTGQGLPTTYVYRFDGSSWSEAQRLTASDGSLRDEFGSSVAIHGNRIAVGAPGHGAAYVFRWDGSSFIEEQKLEGTMAFELYGSCVAIHDGVLLVGAPSKSTGFAYVYHLDVTQNQWSLDQKLVGGDSKRNDRFGNSVAARDDFLFVGAHWHGNLDGAVYVFHRTPPNQWVQTQKLTSLQRSGWFGSSVCIDRDLLAVGSPYENIDRNRALGHVYLYRFDGRFWLQDRTLSASNGEAGDRLGVSVAVTGTAVATGAEEVSAGRGAVYVFDSSAFQLSADPSSAGAGVTLTLDTCGGLDGAPVLLALVDLNGTATFVTVATGKFDVDRRRKGGRSRAGGEWILSATVPPGLSGLVATFQSFGFAESGEFEATNPATVAFQ